MWKVMLVHPEIMDSEQPTWEILKLIIQAQYQITAIGIVFLVAISIIIIGVNLIGIQRKVKKITSGLQAKMNSLTEELQKTKDEMGIELLLLKGQTAKIISNIYFRDRNFPEAASMSSESIKLFSEADRGTHLKLTIPDLIYFLKKSEFLYKNTKRAMIDNINYLPDELKDEREEIRELINKLPVKETKEEI